PTDNVSRIGSKFGAFGFTVYRPDEHEYATDVSGRSRINQKTSDPRPSHVVERLRHTAVSRAHDQELSSRKIPGPQRISGTVRGSFQHKNRSRSRLQNPNRRS